VRPMKKWERDTHMRDKKGEKFKFAAFVAGNGSC
jgi:hypothetical protein